MAKKVEFPETDLIKNDMLEGGEIVNATDDIQDIDLSVTRKKRFRIDGDNNRVLELNVSDLNILPRLQETYPKLEKLSEKATSDWPEDDGDGIGGESASKTAELLREIDMEMRELVDYIFDSNVSEVCAPDGSMFDPFGGRMRFDHIIEVLSSLYENNIDAEVKKMRKNVNKHTSKYIK